MKNKMDMTSGNLFKKTLIFAIPVMLTSILQLLYNTCDVMVVGKFAGDEALAAVGSTGSLINLIINLFFGVSIGVNVSYAKAIGEKDDIKAKKVVHTSFIACFFMSIILMIVAIPNARFFLKLMDSPDDVIDLATIYVKIFFCGIFFNLLYNFEASIFRAHGDTKRPLIALSIAGVLNVGLNLLFVIVFKMSVSGVAIATIISQFTSALILFIIMLKEKSSLNFSFKDLKLDFDSLKEMISIGFLSGIQSMFFSMSNVIIQKAFNSFPSTAIAANGVAGNIEGYSYVVMNAFYQSTISFTSQNYGAKKSENFKKILGYNLILVTIFGIIISAVMIALSPLTMRLYTNSSEVMGYAFERLIYVNSFYFIFGISDIFVASLRGMKQNLVPTIICLLFICILRVVWIKTAFVQTETLKSLYFSYPLSWTINVFVLLIVYNPVLKKAVKSIN